MPKKISKPFAVATEGQTVDGRNIQRDWIIQMAKYYSPNVYTAVANIEHLLSLDPDGMFSAQGKVISVGTREADILGEKKLQMLVVMEVDEEVAAMQKRGKKAFPSIEVTPNFANKGIAYLTGLAFTDRPASLGTETMRFSAGKENVYSFGGEGEVIEWEDEKPAAHGGENLFAKVMGLLKSKDKKDEDRFADTGKAVEAIAESQREVLNNHASLQAQIKDLADKLAAAETKADEDRAAFAALKSTLDKQEADHGRPPATGSHGSGTPGF